MSNTKRSLLIHKTYKRFRELKSASAAVVKFTGLP